MNIVASQAEVAVHSGRAPEMAKPVVLFVSAVADRKGGAETVLLDMMRNPAIQPVLAVPQEGPLSVAAARLGITTEFYSLGVVATVRRPLRATAALRAARDAAQAAWRIAEIAHARGAGIVHTNGLKVHMIGCLARALFGTPVLVHQHDVPYTAAERVLWYMLMKGARHTIAAHNVCLPAPRRGLPRRTGVVMQGLSESAAMAPRSLPSRPVLGFVGRIHPFKGVHLLLEWFEAAAVRHPHITLLLRGNISDEGQAYWAGMQPRFDRLAAAGRCRIEGWRSLGEDPLGGIDILVAPSAVPEAGPRVIMEAMLRGIPAIGALSGGAIGMIPDSACGGKAADLPGFLIELDRLLDPHSYVAVSAAAMAHARREFGIKRFWRDINAEYDILLSSQRNATT